MVMQSKPLRRREFRVICQMGATPADRKTYYVDRVMFDDATGEIRVWRGCSPFGYTLEQFRLDCRDYLESLRRKFIFLPQDHIYGEFAQRHVPVNEAYENAEIESTTVIERKYDYRVGLDALGRYIVYRCKPTTVANGHEFSRAEAATAVASSEEEIAREILFMCGSIHRPMIDASNLPGYDKEISSFVPEELPTVNTTL